MQYTLRMLCSKREASGAVLLIVSCLAPGAFVRLDAQSIGSTSHGTCAIAVQNGKNVAFIIDSSVIVNSVGLFGPLPSKKILECKVWAPMPNMLVSSTGLTESTRPKWNSQESGRRWLSTVSLKSTLADVDGAMQGWGQELIDVLKLDPSATLRPNGEIASLFVIFRLGGRSHFYKERIAQYQGSAVRDNLESVRLDLPEIAYVHLTSGSCRSFVKVNGWPPTIKPTDSEKETLEKLANDMLAPNITAEQLNKSVLLYEENFATLSNNHAVSDEEKDQIGPPYQIARFSDEESAWLTNFKDPCVNVDVPSRTHRKPTRSTKAGGPPLASPSPFTLHK
jgi:hypothetical protein